MKLINKTTPVRGSYLNHDVRAVNATTTDGARPRPTDTFAAQGGMHAGQHHDIGRVFQAHGAHLKTRGGRRGGGSGSGSRGQQGRGIQVGLQCCLLRAVLLREHLREQQLQLGRGQVTQGGRQIRTCPHQHTRNLNHTPTM